jgi:transcriptional regulator with XRE-family HTH domain
MPETALGVWLKGLRDRRDLSLRDVAERSEVDHAYIYRIGWNRRSPEIGCKHTSAQLWKWMVRKCPGE